MKKQELIGNTYGRLKVISLETTDSKYRKYWRCRCICGNETVVRGDVLLSGATKSCGCIRRIGNEFKVTPAGVKIYFRNVPSFMWCDYEDFKAVRAYTWTLQRTGYATTTIKGKTIFFHRFILSIPEDGVVDHINGNRLDNRKKNLRVVTRKENAINRKVMRNSTTGITGVGLNRGKARAYIGINGRYVHLGTYRDIKDAVKVRESAEKRYFGEYARKK